MHQNVAKLRFEMGVAKATIMPPFLAPLISGNFDSLTGSIAHLRKSSISVPKISTSVKWIPDKCVHQTIHITFEKSNSMLILTLVLYSLQELFTQ